jgi:hypothetical protein
VTKQKTPSAQAEGVVSGGDAGPWKRNGRAAEAARPHVPSPERFPGGSRL